MLGDARGAEQRGAFALSFRMKKRGSTWKTAKGFSIIELLVLCTIIGILGTVAWARLGALAPKYRLEGAARSLAGELQKARGQAIANSQCVRIFFDSSAKTYRIDTVRAASCTGAIFTNGVPIKIEDTGTIGIENALGGGDPPAPIFDSRGANSVASNVRVFNNLGDARLVTVNTVGRVNVQ